MAHAATEFMVFTEHMPGFISGNISTPPPPDHINTHARPVSCLLRAFFFTRYLKQKIRPSITVVVPRGEISIDE